MQIVIESATPHDRPDLVRLLSEMHETAGQLCVTRQAATTLVARKGSQAVGLVMASYVGYGVESYGTIDELVVDPSVRGQGVGRELVKGVGGWFSGLGCDVVFVSALNAHATSFWRREGFRHCTGDWLYGVPSASG